MPSFLSPPTTTPVAAINRRLMFVAILLIGFVIVLGVLAATLGVSGAVIAQGQVAVQSSVKKIQHPTGGVVASINTRDGAHVRAGDVLVSLDPTAPGANVTIVDDAVNELAAKEARLEAERDNRETPRFDALDSTPSALRARDDEQRLFRIHAAARAGEKAQLRERIVQLNEQIHSYEVGAQAKKQEIVLINSELTGIRELFKQNLVPLARLNALERDATQLNGDVAQFGAAEAEARGKIAETQLQMIQVDQTARADAGNQLGEVQNQLAELRQKKVTAQQDFQRVQIRSPINGVVDHLTVHTIGGVIAPGETIMIIVPESEGLRVEARIKPSDVDHVHIGQTAHLRFSAFDLRTTPELTGKVTHISAETQVDDKSGASFYVVDVSIPLDAVAKSKMKLIPGMPVETFIETGRRSMLSFLTKPLTDQITRAFREG